MSINLIDHYQDPVTPFKHLDNLVAIFKLICYTKTDFVFARLNLPNSYSIA